MFQSRHRIVTLMVVLLGCGDDLPDGPPPGMLASTGEGNDGNDSSSSSDGADETGDSGGPVADGAPCEFDEEIGTYYFDDEEPPSTEEVTLNGLDDCNFDGILDNDEGLFDDDDFEIWIYHPQDDLGDWPEDHPPFPAVFMSPGGGHEIFGSGLSPHRYLPMFAAIARAGFVVIAIEPPITWSSGRRRAALACAMIWAREDDTLSPHLADVMAILGHSRGGGGAYLLTRDILAGTNLPSGTSLDEWSQCATVTIAQSYAMGVGQDPTDTNLPIMNSTTPPLLALQGTIDEDTRNAQITAFDNHYSEAFIDAQTSQPDQNDELLLLVYGQSHNTWGGTSLGGDDLISPYYVPEFLRWQIMGEQERRATLVAPMAWDADSSSFPTAIATSSLWTTGNNDIYYSGCAGTPEDPCPAGQAPLAGLGRPLIYANYTQGVTWNGSSRFALDLLEEGRQSGPYCEDFESPNLPLNTLGGPVLAEATLEGQDLEPCVCEASASSLLAGNDDPELNCEKFVDDGMGGYDRFPFGDIAFDAHDTGAMLVQWGGFSEAHPSAGRFPTTC